MNLKKYICFAILSIVAPFLSRGIGQEIAVVKKSNAEYRLTLANGAYYKVRLKAKLTSDRPRDSILIELNGTLIARFKATTEWSDYLCYFYSKENLEAAKLRLSTASTDGLDITDLRIDHFQLTNDTELFPATDFGRESINLWRYTSYGKNSTPYDISAEADESSITGSKINIAAPDGALGAVTSISLPVYPGESYRLELWAKANRDYSMLVQVYSSFDRDTMWSTGGKFAVVREWTKLILDFKAPSNIEKFKSLENGTVFILLMGEKVPADIVVNIAGVSLKQISGN